MLVRRLTAHKPVARWVANQSGRLALFRNDFSLQKPLCFSRQELAGMRGREPLPFISDGYRHNFILLRVHRVNDRAGGTHRHLMLAGTSTKNYPDSKFSHKKVSSSKLKACCLELGI